MTLEFQIEPLEARVLGVLIEKELTTPDAYPLTLNSVTLGANQKNNRDPVLDLMEGETNVAIQKLIRRGLVGSVHPIGSRVEKFRHNAHALLKLETPQVALLAELMLRGPQAPGELRGRVARMTPCETLERLTEILRPMLESGLVVRLDPMPGTRAERYAQKLAPDAHPLNAVASAPVRLPTTSSAPIASTPTAAYVSAPAQPARDPRVGPLEEKVEEQEKRMAELEGQVSRLRRQLDQLAWQLGKKLEA
ncbi:MAG: DUF480 domain-containing protein [Planctomycetes bacterium]|nr:DUF480 domain-containing protein [Planctomycetota bacterium]